MATNMIAIKIEGDQLLADLTAARERLADAQGELVLDFSAVRRIDAAAMNAIEALALSAEQASVKLVLHGVNVDVYKVLKLVNLASHLSIVLE